MRTHLRLSLHSVPQQQPSLPATRSTSDCGAVGNVANAEPSGHGFTHDDSNLTAKTTLEAGMDNDCGELASGLHSSQDASGVVADRRAGCTRGQHRSAWSGVGTKKAG